MLGCGQSSVRKSPPQTDTVHHAACQLFAWFLTELNVWRFSRWAGTRTRASLTSPQWNDTHMQMDTGERHADTNTTERYEVTTRCTSCMSSHASYSHTDGAFTDSVPDTLNLKWLISLPTRYHLIKPAIRDLDSHWNACPNESYWFWNEVFVWTVTAY